MTTQNATETIRLPRDKAMSLPRHSRQHGLTVRRGIVWLTDTPADGDILLEAGDQFYFAGRGALVLEALVDAEIILLG